MKHYEHLFITVVVDEGISSMYVSFSTSLFDEHTFIEACEQPIPYTDLTTQEILACVKQAATLLNITYTNSTLNWEYL